MFSGLLNYDKARHRLSADEFLRFQKFAYKKLRHALRLLMFGLPLLFALGWARDLVVLGDTAQWTLLLRLALTFGLLILASLTWLSGFSRSAELFGTLYALFFSVAIAVTSSIEPERLSLTHVPVMLMAIIFLPFALTRLAAVTTALALILPMYGMLWYLDAPRGLWGAYTLFFAAGGIIGATLRRAQLSSSMEIFLYRERLLRRLHQAAAHQASFDAGDRDNWETRAHFLHRHQRDTQKDLSVVRLDLDPIDDIRERHGNESAAELMKQATGVMRDCLRHGDLLARVDGRSFVVLLPGSDADTAARVVERIRGAIAGMAGDTPITLSVGITQTREREALKAATGRAEAAMREARLRGCDRVVLG
ncbi:GGDEF domain-containing protein [Marilutibacter spongiae]|uniref:diguanylate cyclase n=1 Tax=Marilutibacter spongiae TaxID=2025720 RepID=A0A7W3TJI3_9GAMM|nr:diguanylate cyclase [Lysobacter spongiae]MBB1059468.1 diguanylate cyclase [Lysobacter spongiae]